MSASDAGVGGEWAVANKMTKNWFSALGRREITWQNDVNKVPGTMKNINERLRKLKAFRALFQAWLSFVIQSCSGVLTRSEPGGCMPVQCSSLKISFHFTFSVSLVLGSG